MLAQLLSILRYLQRELAGRSQSEQSWLLLALGNLALIRQQTLIRSDQKGGCLARAGLSLTRYIAGFQ